MATTRRTVLIQGGVIGAGLLAGGLSGVAALAAQKSPPVRRSLEGLTWNDPIVATYRDAVGIMKQKPSNDPFNWVQLAGIHGDVNKGFHFCPHGDWYFLPWHRAFTVMYERIVRHLTNNDEFAMPYWDWTANPVMPEVFLPQQTPDGKTNWLCVNEDGMQRTWPPTQPMPDNIVGQAVMNQILNATPYEIFGTSRAAGQDSLDPSWVTNGGGVQGTLEATPHNQVHNNIGGWMPTAASPRDPIFFMHHGNIDRIWATWNLQHANSTDPLWTDMPFTKNFLNPDGSFWSPKVSDLYDPVALGYAYGLTGPQVAAGSRSLALENALTTVLATPRPTGAAADNLVTASVDNTRTATPGAPLTLSVPVSADALRSVARRAPVGQSLDTSASRGQEAGSMRALAILRDVAITDPSTTSVDVFLGAEAIAPGATSADPRYVGTFAVLDHGGNGHGGHGVRALPSFVLDLTGAIQRVYGGSTPPAAVALQVVSVAGAPGVGKAGTVTPKRVEIIVISA